MNVACETTIDDCVLVALSTQVGKPDCTTIGAPDAIPLFNIRRIYYLYDIPAGATRGGHAHRRLHQLVVAASGSFDMLIDDGASRKVVTLNRPDHGVHVVPGIWRELFNFSASSACLVMASELYDEADYLRDYGDFEVFKTGGALDGRS